MNTEDGDVVQRILDGRARELARRPPQEATGDYAQVLVIRLGEEKYGLDIEDVNEVREAKRIAPLPGLPAYWAGIVNLRGNLYPVLDMERFLKGGPGKPNIARSADGNRHKSSETSVKIVLVSTEGLQACLLVEEIIGVRRVLLDNLEPPVGEEQRTQKHIIQGITTDFLTLIDIEQILSDPDLAVDFSRF